jgi:hypothetical protein
LGVAVKDWLTASQVVALIVVVPCRKHAVAYEGTKAQHLGKGDVAYSHIGDSLRRLTSVDVGSKRNGFEFRKLFIEGKRKDVAYSHIEERGRRQALMVCRLI